MYCSKCGAWASDTDTLCTNCGAVLRPAAAPGTAPAPEFASPPAFAPAPVVAAPVTAPVPAPIYAGFWRRFWTGLVDYTVCFPFGLAVRILLGVGLFESEWSRPSAMVFAFGVISGWLYDALMESSRWQGTLGQQLIGVRVTDRLGRRISFARATARHVAQYLSIFTLGVGYLVMLFNRRRLTLHDWISGCEIVRGGLEAPATMPILSTPSASGGTLSPLGGGAGR